MPTQYSKIRQDNYNNTHKTTTTTHTRQLTTIHTRQLNTYKTTHNNTHKTAHNTHKTTHNNTHKTTHNTYKTTHNNTHKTTHNTHKTTHNNTHTTTNNSTHKTTKTINTRYLKIQHVQKVNNTTVRKYCTQFLVFFPTHNLITLSPQPFTSDHFTTHINFSNKVSFFRFPTPHFTSQHFQMIFTSFYFASLHSQMIYTDQNPAHYKVYREITLT